MMRTPTTRAAAVTARWPIATVSVLAVTGVLTALQFPFPQARTALWRDLHHQGDRIFWDVRDAAGIARKEDVMTITTAEMATGSVVSKDGTRIGYLRVGRGPAVVLLHGSSESARGHTHLAMALADAFTVYLPDRRGRGLSGPHRPDHSIRTEVEDLQAVLTESGAQRVFGASTGGLIVLEAARRQPGIRKVAAYEPALLMDTTRYTGWVGRFDREMAQGRVAAAVITSVRGLDLAPTAFKLMPRPLAEALTNKSMDREDKKAAGGTVTIRKLAPTLRWEGLLLAETAGTIGSFAEVPAEVLLLGGDMKRPAFIRPAFDALAKTLPHNRRVRFPGLDHGGSADVGPTSRGGKPEIVAPAIRSFFTQP
jgi:pimeloyl-ACP methyl ester carboxylesterase